MMKSKVKSKVQHFGQESEPSEETATPGTLGQKNKSTTELMQRLITGQKTKVILIVCVLMAVLDRQKRDEKVDN